MGEGQTKTLTIPYSCVQTPFWMSLCVFSSFCAVYLQSLGYSNAELGIVMACGTLAGSLLGPWLSSLIDQSNHDRITAVTTMPPEALCAKTERTAAKRIAAVPRIAPS